MTTTRAIAVTAAAAAMVAIASPALAGPASGAPAKQGRARKKVVLAPLTTLGEEVRSRQVRQMERAVLDGIAAQPNTAIVSMTKLLAELKQARRDDLRNCDGDVECLADLGILLSADLVVYGEVGGVGELQIAYLKLIEVAGRRELRSTTLELDGKADAVAARAAAVRLLDPGRYVGTLALDVDVGGASIYIDGALRARSPAKPMPLSVGTHAVRITHPEYRDFVRFVDVQFQSSERIQVGLQQYPIVASDMRRTEAEQIVVPVGPVRDEPTPWYRQWYTIAGAGAALVVTSAIVFAVVSGGVDADQEKVIE